MNQTGSRHALGQSMTLTWLHKVPLVTSALLRCMARAHQRAPLMSRARVRLVGGACYGTRIYC